MPSSYIKLILVARYNMKSEKRAPIPQLILIAGYFIFVGISLIVGFEPGQQIGRHFWNFTKTMLGLIPCAFILVSLFDVWVNRETVEKHFGEQSGWKGYLWAILLAGTVTGGIYVALPVAYALYKKGAHFGPLFTYISAASICRIPMTAFEASILGVKFTVIRFLVSLPLVVFSSILLAKYLAKINFQLTEN